MLVKVQETLYGQCVSQCSIFNQPQALVATRLFPIMNRLHWTRCPPREREWFFFLMVFIRMTIATIRYSPLLCLLCPRHRFSSETTILFRTTVWNERKLRCKKFKLSRGRHWMAVQIIALHYGLRSPADVPLLYSRDLSVCNLASVCHSCRNSRPSASFPHSSPILTLLWVQICLWVARFS